MAGRAGRATATGGALLGVGFAVSCGAANVEQSGAQTAGSAAAAQPPLGPVVKASGGYRFARPPVVYLDRDPDEAHDVTYSVLIRMNRPLPREGVDIGAALTVGGAGPGGEILRYGRRSRACYTAEINFPAPEIPKPKLGLVVNVRLKIDEVPQELVAHTRLRDYRKDRAPSHHCGKGGFDEQD